MRSTRDEAETIRREMARIRRSHHEDITDVLVGAESLAGWGRHIRLLTGTAMSLAALFWMLSNRWRRVSMSPATRETVAVGAEGNRETEAAVALAQPGSPHATLAGELARFLTTVAIRAAQNYTACRLEEWLASRPGLGTHNLASASHVSEGAAHPGGCRPIELSGEDREKPGLDSFAGTSRELGGVSHDG